MPELPEVESVRRQLEPRLRGRVVERVWFDDHPAHRFHDIHDLVGREVDEVTRRGKFIVCSLTPVEAILGPSTLASSSTHPSSSTHSTPSTHSSSSAHPSSATHSTASTHSGSPAATSTPSRESTSARRAMALPRDDLQLVLHLGMTGSLRFVDPDAPSEPHVRVQAWLDDDHRMDFRDPRRFGRFSVVAPENLATVVPTLATLGPEPLTEDFTVAGFAASLAATSAPVKAVLLGQRAVAGVGNIYADEALWRARIHPASRRVGAERAARLHLAIREVLAESIEREGTTFRDYQMINGESGRNADFLDAYGQEGLPCNRCGTPMRKTTLAQRGTTYCPTCQH